MVLEVGIRVLEGGVSRRVILFVIGYYFGFDVLLGIFYIGFVGFKKYFMIEIFVFRVNLRRYL